MPCKLNVVVCSVLMPRCPEEHPEHYAVCELYSRSCGLEQLRWNVAAAVL